MRTGATYDVAHVHFKADTRTAQHIEQDNKNVQQTT